MKREYPEQPIVGVGGIVVNRGKVLLVRRGRPPLKGEWSIPGGVVELGEDMKRTVRRELLEETGIRVKPVAVMGVFNRIVRAGRRLRYHFVIIDYACRPVGGRIAPASDALDACWAPREDLSRFRLRPELKKVIRETFDYFDRRPPRRKPGPRRIARQKLRSTRLPPPSL